MDNAASFIVDILIWIGVALILFILFSVAFLLKLKDSSNKKKHPTDKRNR